MSGKTLVGINGLGRTGLTALRAWWDHHRHGNIEIVAINNRSGDPETLARRIRRDSVYGKFPAEVIAGQDSISVGGREIRVFRQSDPAKIDWSSVGVQVVVEATGNLETREEASQHLGGSVRKVVISSAGKGELDLMTVIGVNHEMYDPSVHHVIANASCTTNCLAPMVKVMHEAFGIRHGIMTTIHAYTNDQNLVDGAHKDPWRARAAGVSIIPTTTGAASAVGKVYPALAGKLTGMALRVPTLSVSLVDLTVELERAVTKENINAAFRTAAEGPLRGILGYVNEVGLVSSDFRGDSESSIFDPTQTIVMDGTQAKIFGWYDNEYGYSCRLMEIVDHIAQRELVAV